MNWIALICSIHIGCVEIATETREECVEAIPQGIVIVLEYEREFVYGDPTPYRTLEEMTEEEFVRVVDGLRYRCVGDGHSVSLPNV